MENGKNKSKQIELAKLEFSDLFRAEEVDLHKVLKTFGGKKSILKMTTEITLKNFDKEMKLLENAITDKDFVKIVFNAHKMKGYISIFGVGLELCEIFKEMELYAAENTDQEDLKYICNLFEISKKQSVGFKQYLEKIDTDKL